MISTSGAQRECLGSASKSADAASSRAAVGRGDIGTHSEEPGRSLVRRSPGRIQSHQRWATLLVFQPAEIVAYARRPSPRNT